MTISKPTKLGKHMRLSRITRVRYRFERPSNWIAMVGFMGAGKSRIGCELARRLGLNFIDTDKVVERVSCMPIAEIFSLYGEEVFRDYEAEIIRRAVRLEDAVISTGGGTVVRAANRDLLRARGPVIRLKASAETTYHRTRRHKRPLLEVGNPVERIRSLMAEREAMYTDVATITVSTDGRRSSDVVEEVVHALHDWRVQQEAA